MQQGMPGAALPTVQRPWTPQWNSFNTTRPRHEGQATVSPLAVPRWRQLAGGGPAQRAR
jgi:hypothetical protein